MLSPDRKHLLGGMLVGDASAYGELLQIAQNQIVLPPAPETLILPAGSGGGKPAGAGVAALPDGAQICSCNNVSKGAICTAIREQKLTAVGAVKSCTRAGTTCGSCVPLVTELLKVEMKRAGLAVSNHLCEHFPHSRQELYHLVRFHKHKTFDAALATHGQGRGCEICKPAVASILASAWNEHVMAPKHRPLQDTNDRFMANIQRDGTYSIVPRVAGGRDHARPAGRDRAHRRHVRPLHQDHRRAAHRHVRRARRAAARHLARAGRRRLRIGPRLRQGAAHREVVRRQHLVPLRRAGLGQHGGADREPLQGPARAHKLKSAVSGCARECAEAQGKDFGIIATEKGWNLYLCGNGGMKPQHAQLFATDLDDETLIKYIDRFLMFYVRTADRLQRTATWFNNLEGGMDYLRSVIVDDSLGICAELEAEMAHVIDTYECEWKAALSDPEKLRQFRPFVNSDSARSQHRARPRARPASARDLGGEDAARPGAGPGRVGPVSADGPFGVARLDRRLRGRGHHPRHRRRGPDRRARRSPSCGSATAKAADLRGRQLSTRSATRS